MPSSLVSQSPFREGLAGPASAKSRLPGGLLLQTADRGVHPRTQRHPEARREDAAAQVEISSSSTRFRLPIERCSRCVLSTSGRQSRDPAPEAPGPGRRPELHATAHEPGPTTLRRGSHSPAIFSAPPPERSDGRGEAGRPSTFRGPGGACRWPGAGERAGGGAPQRDRRADPDRPASDNQQSGQELLRAAACSAGTPRRPSRRNWKSSPGSCSRRPGESPARRWRRGRPRCSRRAGSCGPGRARGRGECPRLVRQRSPRQALRAPVSVSGGELRPPARRAGPTLVPETPDPADPEAIGAWTTFSSRARKSPTTRPANRRSPFAPRT